MCPPCVSLTASQRGEFPHSKIRDRVWPRAEKQKPIPTNWPPTPLLKQIFLCKRTFVKMVSAASSRAGPFFFFFQSSQLFLSLWNNPSPPSRQRRAQLKKRAAPATQIKAHCAPPSERRQKRRVIVARNKQEASSDQSCDQSRLHFVPGDVGRHRRTLFVRSAAACRVSCTCVCVFVCECGRPASRTDRA